MEQPARVLPPSALTFSVALDAEALAWTASEAWRSVFEACPWATAFQSPAFFKVWARHYGSEWRPLLVVGRRPDGSVAGMMPLAVREALIVGAGAHQSEYHGWICSERDAAAFIVGALEAIAAAFPRHLVRLRYLSYSMPAAAVTAAAHMNPRITVHRHPAPTLDIDPAAIQRKLRKSSTRSKAQRLRQLGRLRFTLMSPSAVAENIDQIIAMCDLRQGATNGSCPFLDDPIKRPFHVDWLRSCPDQVRCGTLLLDELIIAALLFVKSGADYHLAIAAHDPHVSEHSPNKLNMYETALALSAEGGKLIDLTPGGDPWKARFLSHDREALELVMHASTAQAARAKSRRVLKTLVHHGLSTVGLSVPVVRRHLSNVRESFVRLRPRAEPVPAGQLYMGIAPALPAVDQARVAAEPLQLMTSSGPRLTKQGRQAFLSHALRRLEEGDRCFVVLDQAGQSAMGLGWRSRVQRADGGDPVLLDDFAIASEADADAAAILVTAMLAQLDRSDHVYARAAHQSPFASALTSLGFAAVSEPGFARSASRPD